MDITMCKGTGCPMKEECLRYTATPNEHWQSYFVNVPYEQIVSVGSQRIFDICDEFLENKK